MGAPIIDGNTLIGPKHVAPLTQRDLAGAKCDTPGCGCNDELAVEAKCHPRVGVVCWYNTTLGTMRIECAGCKQHVITFQVAP